MKAFTYYCALVLFALIRGCGTRMADGLRSSLGESEAGSETCFLEFYRFRLGGPCIEMHKRVFSQKEFLDYAEKHLVVVEFDYPKTKPLTEEIKKQNERLKHEFKIDKLGFPTIALVDAFGSYWALPLVTMTRRRPNIIERIENWKRK